MGFAYDTGLWTALDGMLTARTHPNIMFGNMTRFSPFYATLEVLLGAVACRMVRALLHVPLPACD